MAGLTNPMPTAASAAPQPAAGAAPAPPDPNAAPQTQPGEQPAPGGGGGPLTEGPVDEDLLKKMIANCMNVVTGSLQQIIKTVSGSQDKVAALAQSAVMVVMRVEDSLEQSGGKLNLAMTFSAGAETITDIADASQKAGVYTFKQQEIDAAFLRAVDQYRMIRQKQGRLDPATFQQMIQQMKQAQANGTLDQQYPGLTDFAKKTQDAAKPGYQPQGAAAPSDGDGADTEGPDDQAQESDAPAAPAAGAPPSNASAAPAPKGKAPAAKKPVTPAAGGNFPASMLKKKGGMHQVKTFQRKNPSKKAPLQSPAAPAKVKPKKGGI